MSSETFRPALWLTQPPIQSVPEIKRLACEPDYSPPCNCWPKDCGGTLLSPGWSRRQDLLGVAVTEIWLRQVKSYVNRTMLARPFVVPFAVSECKDGKNNMRLLFCVGVKLGLSH